MKAILVIEMPHCCHDCICADWDMCLCKAKNEEIYSQSYMDGGRQPWCPLKPMPEKNTWDITKNGHVTEYAEGWNACLDEILED